MPSSSRLLHGCNGRLLDVHSLALMSRQWAVRIWYAAFSDGLAHVERYSESQAKPPIPVTGNLTCMHSKSAGGQSCNQIIQQVVRELSA